MVGHVSVVSVTIFILIANRLISMFCRIHFQRDENDGYTKLPLPQPPSAQHDPFFPVDEVKFTYLKSKHFNFNLPKAIIFSFISKPQSFCDPENEGLGGEPQTYLVDYPVIDT